jgi:hypothetical protein
MCKLLDISSSLISFLRRIVPYLRFPWRLGLTARDDSLARGRYCFQSDTLKKERKKKREKGAVHARQGQAVNNRLLAGLIDRQCADEFGHVTTLQHQGAPSIQYLFNSSRLQGRQDALRKGLAVFGACNFQ